MADGGEEAGDAVGRDADIVSIQYGLSGGVAQALAQVGIAHETFDGVGELVAVSRFDEQSVRAVLHEFGDAGDASGDHGPLESHRFDQHDG